MDEATAKKIAKDVGVDLPPAEVAPKKRVARKRNPSTKRQPVTRSFLWSAVDPYTRLHALFRADQDIKRCVPLGRFEVLVLNNPQRKAPR